ncbi:pfkB family carbohydrate kinase domain-containing protein [Phthorimaea operculella]|nr:pfkB family carbohydrate kinase domain-containing protein [Phthorimaea operculella]
MAEALWRLRGGRAKLITAVGDDADGRYIQDIAPGLILEGCVVPGASTATYAAVLDAHGECRLGLGDMDVHNFITPELVDKHRGWLEQAPLVVLDGNVPQTTVDHVLQLCQQMEKPGRFFKNYPTIKGVWKIFF